MTYATFTPVWSNPLLLLALAAVTIGVVIEPPVTARLSDVDTAFTIAPVNVCNALFVLKSLILTPVIVWVTPNVFTAAPGCTAATGAVVRYLEGCDVGCAVG